MPLPEIISPIPSTVPASEEKVYDRMYITSLRILSPGPQQATRVQVDFHNYHAASGTLSPNLADHERLTIADMYAEAARVPRLAATVAEIIAISNLLLQEKHLNEQIEALEAQLGEAGTEAGEEINDQVNALLAELDQVRQGLGIE